MRLRKLLVTLPLVMGLSVINFGINVNATEKEESTGPEVTDYFTIIDENGKSEIVYFDDIKNESSNINDLEKEYDLIAKSGDKEEVIETYDSHADAQSALKSKQRARNGINYSVQENFKDITYGVVYLNSTSVTTNGKGEKYAYIPYVDVNNPHNGTGYTTGAYAKDAAYLGMYNGKIRAVQSGVVMDINAGDATVVDYTQANISHYYTSDGYLYHRFYYGSEGKSNVYRVGYALDYLKSSTNYYSYDGHYFYSDYPTMIRDYQNGRNVNAVNPTNPYYNYYQYLSHRTTSTLTAGNYDSITNDKVGGSESRMKGLGAYYIEYQNTYGANSLLVYGVSGNESAWGTSSIAKDKNNLFGHGAVDSNPYYGANGYEKASDSIKYHAEKYVSSGYLDNEDSRYRGGNLGDKVNGMNVKYASDPYWGEKAASVNYYYNVGNDYGRYTIGIINGVQQSYKLYKDPSFSSSVTHVLGSDKSPVTKDLPVIILDTVTDSSGNKWYKIQSDSALNSSRTDTDWDAKYDFGRDYLYIPTSGVTLVKQGNSIVPTYLKGDVNGDGKVTSLDYIQVKNHIMEAKILSNDYLVRADVNEDGKVTSLDYIKIKNHIMGTNLLF